MFKNRYSLSMALASILVLVGIAVVMPRLRVVADQTKVEIKDVGPELGANSSLDGFIINPQNPLQILASSFRNGVSKSVNGGQTWFRANNGLTHPGGIYPNVFNLRKDPSNQLSIYAVSDDGLFHSGDFGGTWAEVASVGELADCAIDPTSPNVIYALPPTTNSALQKSTDGGTLFEELFDNGLPDFSADPDGVFFSMAIAQTDPNVLYVVENGNLQGIYKSTDGGVSFARLDNSPFFPVQVFPHPTQADTIYVQALSGTTGLFLSTDGGESFEAVTSGLPAGKRNSFVSFEPSNPSTVYVAGFGGLFRSTDDGATFAALGLTEEQKGQQAITLGIDPTNPNVIYVNTSRGNFKSFNGGLNFAAINRSWQVAVVRDIAFDNRPNPSFYVATDGTTFDDAKLLRTTDAGQNYEPIGRSLPSGVRVISIATSATNPERIVITTLRHGIFRSTDEGHSWEPATVDTGQLVFDRSRVAIDPTNSNNVYVSCGAGTFRGFFRSTDGGQNFSRTTTLTSFGDSNALAIDPNNPNVIYTATRATLQKSTDAGLSFTATQLGVSGSVTQIVINPQDSQIVYISGFIASLTPPARKILRSTNGGSTFTPAQNGLGDFFPIGLAIDPANPARLFAWMLDGGLFMTDDSGANWSLLAGGEALLRSGFGRTMAINPKKPNRIYLGGASILEVTIK